MKTLKLKFTMVTNRFIHTWFRSNKASRAVRRAFCKTWRQSRFAATFSVSWKGGVCLTLHDSVTVLPGVGPKRQQALAELGLRTVGDVLFYFPFRYDDLQVKDLAEAADQ